MDPRAVDAIIIILHQQDTKDAVRRILADTSGDMEAKE
jgi:hypothetical protein